MTIFLLMMCGFISYFNQSFLLSSNLINLLRTSSLTVLAAVGLTFALISGHIDLSIGSTIGLGSMVAGLFIVDGWPLWVCILIGTLSGAIIGIFNGIVITKCKIPPLIVTLGSMYFVRGIVNVLSGGRTIHPFPKEFISLGGREGFLGIPTMVWLALVVCVVGTVVLKYTVFGRCVYAIGNDLWHRG